MGIGLETGADLGGLHPELVGQEAVMDKDPRDMTIDEVEAYIAQPLIDLCHRILAEVNAHEPMPVQPLPSFHSPWDVKGRG